MRIDIHQPEMFTSIFQSVTGNQLHHPVMGITTDSRNVDKGDLYIALKGERVDGHTFLDQVSDAGASAALVSCRDENLELQQVKVNDPLIEIGKIANSWRRQFDVPVIGITGSNGKTSTKELLINVLSGTYNVHATDGNFNTHIGLPLTLLQLNESHDISILEMGASVPGDIKVLCTIAEPSHGIITNVAPAHLEGFGSLERIAHEKGALFRSLDKGISFVNQADKMVSNIPFNGPRITFGITPDCDFPADIYHEDDGTLTLILDTHEIPTGSYNLSFIKNSIAVSAIAITLGIGWNDLKKHLQSFSPPAGRCQVKQVANITIIDDTYNANLASSLAALDYLKAFSGNGRRIFVFGDMFELGPTSNEQHRKIGEKCSEMGLDGVFTVGDHTVHTDSAIQNGVVHKHFSSRESLIESLKNMVNSGDKILFKGSRGMAMEKVIKGVFAL